MTYWFSKHVLHLLDAPVLTRRSFAQVFASLLLVSLSQLALSESKSALADGADELRKFASPELRGRFYGLSDQLRCPKCQNQNLADSDAPIAADLRNELYKLLHDGMSDEQILTFMSARYGDFVLYDPPVNKATLALWLLPLSLLAAGVVVMVAMLWRSRAGEDAVNGSGSVDGGGDLTAKQGDDEASEVAQSRAVDQEFQQRMNELQK